MTQPTLRIATMSGSVRVGSFHLRLLDLVEPLLTSQGRVAIDRIDVGRYPLPLYNQDHLDNLGIPDAVYQLTLHVESADALIVASPEYNGGYTPLFKNTLDWITRVDKTVFQGCYVGLMAASGGRMGASNGLRQMTSLFEHIRVTTHEPWFSLPEAPPFLESGDVPGLDDWATGYVGGARTFAAVRTREVADQ